MSAQERSGANVARGVGHPEKSSSAISGRGRGRQSQALQRRVDALQLRQAGLTFRQIGVRLGMTESGARKAVLKALQEVLREKAAEVLELELARLERLHASVWSKALGGDIPATATVLRIMDRRAKYLGLNNPRTTDAVTEGVTLLAALAQQLISAPDTYASDGDLTTSIGGADVASAHGVREARDEPRSTR